MSDVGNNIKNYRKMAKLTQEELGIASGLSTMSIRRYESNNRKPNIDQLRKISIALGTTLGKLLVGSFNDYVEEIKEDFSNAEVIIPKSFQIEVDDKNGKQLEEAKNLFALNPRDPKSRAHAKQVLNEIAIELGHKDERTLMINTITMNINDLNEKGLSKVMGFTQDLLLIKDYLAKSENVKDKSYLEPQAAHERTDIEVTDEMRKHDDDIMNDDNYWK